MDGTSSAETPAEVDPDAGSDERHQSSGADEDLKSDAEDTPRRGDKKIDPKQIKAWNTGSAAYRADEKVRRRIERRERKANRKAKAKAADSVPLEQRDELLRDKIEPAL